MRSNTPEKVKHLPTETVGDDRGRFRCKDSPQPQSYKQQKKRKDFYSISSWAGGLLEVLFHLPLSSTPVAL